MTAVVYSNTQLYKQAGNSIVEEVLKNIFKITTVKVKEREKMGKEEFKDIPDDIKKRIIMMGILSGKDLTVVHQRITLNDSQIENSIGVNRELADLLDIEPDIQEYLNETRDSQYKLTSSILQKIQKMAESIGCNIVERGKWPDKPINFSMDLGADGHD